MKQYIDKDLLIKEIEKYISNYKGILNKIDKSSDEWVTSTLMLESKIDVLQHILYFLNTIDVKEVDLELMKNSKKTLINNALFQTYRHCIIDILNHSESRSNEELADEIMVGYGTLIRNFRELADRYETICKVIGIDKVKKILNESKNKD
jgi:hypothetical protein